MSNPWTPMPHFCGRRAVFDRFKQGAIGLLCAFLLSSCGESVPRGYDGSTSSSTLSPITAPPGADQSPPLPGTTGAPKTPDGLPALSAKGLNTALFSQKLDNDDARMGRLENAVQELRNDFDALSPAIVRLVSIEKDIQNLLKQLEVLTTASPENLGIEPVDAALLAEQEPIQPAPAPLPTPPQINQETSGAENATQDLPAPLAVLPPNDTQLPAPIAREQAIATPTPAPAVATSPAALAQNTIASVTALRIGEHKGKIRMVLDVSGKSNFNADLDNAEKILVIELPQTGWNTDLQKTFDKNPILASYKTEKLPDRGTRLIMVIKSPSEILYKSTLANPDGTARIVIDLKSPQ